MMRHLQTISNYKVHIVTEKQVSRDTKSVVENLGEQMRQFDSDLGDNLNDVDLRDLTMSGSSTML